ncbi:MAG: indolepyruvate ferredoxin oxidoreductase [Mycobacterium sp.]|nr:indolepyruvate ferredoxin oxidoreductase [Mycobacterium sp.]
MRGVRGTALDPFGYAAIRRLERELITEYVGAIRLVAGGLTANLDAAVEIAELPDMVRGYEHVTTDNAARHRQRLAELLVCRLRGYDGPGTWDASAAVRWDSTPQRPATGRPENAPVHSTPITKCIGRWPHGSGY